MNGGKGIYVGGTLISILISLALYFSGKRETAIFVGLWAPTILNLGQSLLDEELEPLYPSGLPGPSDWGSTEPRIDGVLRSLGLRGYRKSRVRQSGRGPSLVGLRPLNWLSRWPTTGKGVVVAIVLLQFLR